jgi:hypothetical protein
MNVTKYVGILYLECSASTFTILLKSPEVENIGPFRGELYVRSGQYRSKING